MGRGGARGGGGAGEGPRAAPPPSRRARRPAPARGGCRPAVLTQALRVGGCA